MVGKNTDLHIGILILVVALILVPVNLYHKKIGKNLALGITLLVVIGAEVLKVPAAVVIVALGGVGPASPDTFENAATAVALLATPVTVLSAPPLPVGDPAAPVPIAEGIVKIAIPSILIVPTIPSIGSRPGSSVTETNTDVIRDGVLVVPDTPVTKALTAALGSASPNATSPYAEKPSIY